MIYDNQSIIAVINGCMTEALIGCCLPILVVDCYNWYHGCDKGYTKKGLTGITVLLYLMLLYCIINTEISDSLDVIVHEFFLQKTRNVALYVLVSIGFLKLIIELLKFLIMSFRRKEKDIVHLFLGTYERSCIYGEEKFMNKMKKILKDGHSVEIRVYCMSKFTKEFIYRLYCNAYRELNKDEDIDDRINFVNMETDLLERISDIKKQAFQEVWGSE